MKNRNPVHFPADCSDFRQAIRKKITGLLVFESVLLYHISGKRSDGVVLRRAFELKKHQMIAGWVFSMTIKTDLGYIEMINEVMAGIAGYAASSCFGVKGMTIRSMSDGLAHLLGRENQSRGVKVTEAPDGGVNIDLHIAVEHGVNVATVCRSIISEVRYHVERLTGVDVKNVDIYVESIRAD